MRIGVAVKYFLFFEIQRTFFQTSSPSAPRLLVPPRRLHGVVVGSCGPTSPPLIGRTWVCFRVGSEFCQLLPASQSRHHEGGT